MDKLNTKDFEIRKSKRKILGYRFTSLYLRNASTPQQVAKTIYKEYALQADTIYRNEEVYDPEFIHYVNYVLNKPISIQEKVWFETDGTFFQAGMRPNTIRFRSKPNQWSILPISCATPHSRHAVMLLRRNGRTFCFDPNGTKYNFKGVIYAFKVLYTALGEHVDFTDTQSPRSPWLLNIDFQTEALRFIDTDGLCGAFVASVAVLIALNPTATRAQINAYFLTRQKQWRTEFSALATLQSILQLPPHMLKKTSVYEHNRTNLRSAYIPANVSRYILQQCKQHHFSKIYSSIKKYPLSWVLCPSVYTNNEQIARDKLDHQMQLPYDARILLLKKGVAISFLESYILLNIAYFHALKKSAGFYLLRARGWKRQFQRGFESLFKSSHRI